MPDEHAKTGVHTCGECRFFTHVTHGPETGQGFCRGGPPPKLPMREANAYSAYARPIYSAEEPECVLFSPRDPVRPEPSEHIAVPLELAKRVIYSLRQRAFGIALSAELAALLPEVEKT